MEEGEDVTFDAAVKQIAATSSVTSDAMLVSQGVFSSTTCMLPSVCFYLMCSIFCRYCRLCAAVSISGG